MGATASASFCLTEISGSVSRRPVRAFEWVEHSTMLSADFCLRFSAPLGDDSAGAFRRTVTDLPGYCAQTFTLMPATYTSYPSVQVWDFEDICLLIRVCRLLCGFCSSGQRFACGFLRIPPRGGHPCRPANDSPCRVRRGLAPPSPCALPGAQMTRGCPMDGPFFILP
jgi:hypothetical protein